MLFPSLSSLLAIAEILWVNILLSGDNALVIALACRGLPARRRWLGMVLGAVVAILLRLVFTGIVAQLLQVPFLRIIGGVALLWIAVKLVASENDATDDMVATSDQLFGAIRAIAIADLVMSLDNVIAISAIAQGDPVLLAIGLLISIPIIVVGASLIMVLLGRFPILLWAGGGLLGWIAGEMEAQDPWVIAHIHSSSPGMQTAFAMAGTLLAMLGALILRWRSGAAATCVPAAEEALPHPSGAVEGGTSALSGPDADRSVAASVRYGAPPRHKG